MGARTFRELVAWQRADELRRRTYQVIQVSPAGQDRPYRQQLESAVSSVAANIAEGFGRFSHAEFARFLRIAMGSLAEVNERLLDGIARGYLSAAQYTELEVLIRRTGAAMARLRAYLRRTSTPD